ncbi:MAG: hypothetical protein HOW97_04550 [Catenulispora sp.]|nr:hypothetical protein [Catenulispora sp.]
MGEVLARRLGLWPERETAGLSPKGTNMNDEPRTPSVMGPAPTHPLTGLRPARPRMVLVILVGWLAWHDWTSEQIVALLLVLMPTAATRHA